MAKTGRTVTRIPFECTGEGCTTMLTPSPRRKGTLCRSCLCQARRLPDRFCLDCGVPIGRDPKKTPTNRCVTHSNKVEERCRNISIKLKEKHADPNFTAKRKPILDAAQRRRMADPVLRAAAVEHMRKVGLQFGGSAHRREDQKRIQWKARNTKLADIPLAYRDEYVALGERHRIPAAERKRMILDEVAAVTKRHHKQKD